MADVLPSLVVLVVIASGAALAWVARLLLPASRRLAWSTTIVVAVTGAALAWLPLDLLLPEAGGLSRLVVGLGGAIAAVAVATAVLLARRRRRARGVAGATAETLITAGESGRVEFKSTARINTRTGERDPRMEEEVVVTVAGFLNAAGGTLLLGVADDGRIVGMEDDYAVTPRHDRDGFELWFRQLLVTRMGKLPTTDIGVTYHVMDGRDVCRVDVAPADRPVFVRGTGGTHAADFHLRIGNATRKLLTDEVLEYCARRWP